MDESDFEGLAADLRFLYQRMTEAVARYVKLGLEVGWSEDQIIERANIPPDLVRSAISALEE